MIEVKESKINFEGKEISLRTGEYAHQANGSVILQCGETVIHAVCCMNNSETGLDFFPLTVEYVEHLYAGGIIKGSRFIKREGRPSDEAILKARLIDRAIRPMFPKDFKKDVQVVINILASDGENPHDVLALTAVVAALAISDIPFDSNLAGIRVSRIDGKIVANPTYSECEKQDYELVLGGNKERIIMIECAASCVPDDLILEGFEKSFDYLGVLSDFIADFKNKYGKTKIEYEVKEDDAELEKRIKELTLAKIEDFYAGLKSGDLHRKQFNEVVVDPVLEIFSEEEIEDKDLVKTVKEMIDKIFKKRVREKVLKDRIRLDGRDINKIRNIELKIDTLPRVHGSSMFMRGETQVLSILTLDSPGNELILESIEGETTKRYFHHYTAPPYSVGETGRMGSPGRREIGHGALAEKALLPVLPDVSKFPYVMRVVSEVMGQNGSSSMASTCASTLTLMSGGVPIKDAVAGISIGLMTGDDISDFVTLTDIQGMEDFSGDMDFKIAGTRETITAIQMDTKIKGLSWDIIKAAVPQAKEARNVILDMIESVIKAPKSSISEYAPKIESLQIPVDMISKVIGSGGKVIKRITEENDVDISIDDLGVVTVSGRDKEKIDKTITIVNGIVNDLEVNKVYKGKIARVLDFGAIVEIFPGKEGLIHISKMSKERVNKVEDVVNVGDDVEVLLYEIDNQGRYNFTLMLDFKYEKKADDNRPQRRSVNTRNHRR